MRESHRFDLIVLDLSMPVMDGRALYHELRALPCDSPVLLLSAYGAEEAQRALGAEAAMTSRSTRSSSQTGRRS